MKTTLYFFLTSLLMTAGAAAQGGMIQLSDMLRIKQPGGVDVSADGRKVLFTLTTSVPDEKSKWEYPYQTQLWMAALDDSSAPRPLTTSRDGASQAAWSPDGQRIAFVRVVEQKPQIFLLSLQGGEPQQLNRMANGATQPRWSPDGTQLLFFSSFSLNDLAGDSLMNPGKKAPQWPVEKPGFDANEHLTAPYAAQDPDGSMEEIRAWLKQNEKDSKAKVFNKLNFQQEAVTSSQLSFQHLFVMEARQDATPRPLTTGFCSYSNAQYAGDSSILLESVFRQDEHPDRAQLETAIYQLHPTSGRISRLLGAADSSFSGSQVSPSGKWLAFSYGKTSFVSVRKLAIMPVGGDRSTVKEIAIDRSVGGLDWSSDEQYLYFTTPANGGQVLHRYTLATGSLEALTPNDQGVGSFDEEAGRMVLVKTEVANPYELYLTDAQAAKPRRLTALHHEWLRNKKLSIPEKRSFINDKGMEVDYWVMKPTQWEAGKKYPAILQIHGGPTAMWGPGEPGMWHEYQYYCARGYTVVYSNPRGSGGYGEKFLQGNLNDWGAGPASDVLTALDRSAKEFTWIDTSKLAVTGGSYAGYLVAWILGHDQRFKAACAQRGVYDLRTFFGEGNAWRLVPNYFGGYPWEKETYANLERESPINYVQNVTTPLIIFHGENDLRTGVIQSEQYYRSLKVLGRTVEYVRHPGATHEITRSGNNRQRMDQMLRTYEFFERFIKH